MPGHRELQVESSNFRTLMGQFATGVTLVTAQSGTRVHGMTANAVASVSLDPLMVLVCVGKRARLSGYLRETGSFVINILSRDQESIARHFAGPKDGVEPPEMRLTEWECAPRLEGALGYIACRTEQVVDAGDHWVAIGRVAALAEGAIGAEPLLFYAGHFRRIGPIDETIPDPPDLMSTFGATLHHGEWT
jgi:flavin reductase (DIM6/NTAB) family NADH-FMN oxidoreductase RutF